MDRRKFLALAGSGLAAVQPALALGGSEPAAEKKAHVVRKRKGAPNVILMICDDLGFGDLGCYGSKLATPNLDRMAAEGVRFTRFNSGHPICSASRAALLTGRYGLRMGTTGAFGPNSKMGTSTDETLLSNLFKAKEYKTKAIGKWHLGDAAEYLPTSRGFDSYFGVPYSVDMHPTHMVKDGKVIEEETDPKTLTPRYTTEALEFLDHVGGDPFFLYLGFNYPHDPPMASERFAGKSGLGDQGDSIAEIDWSAGEILKAVEKHGLGADTLVMFTSDHGPWYQGNPGALRGRKASTFEGGFRVPLIARWPGMIAEGRVEATPCSNLDMLPSMQKICGLGKTAHELDGVDASALLLGTGETIEERARIYFSPMGDRGTDVHCIRKGDWKMRVAQSTQGEAYINDRTTGARSSAWLPHAELYDLGRDPAESYNVAKVYPEKVKELTAELEALMPTFPEPVQKAYVELKAKVGNETTPAGASPRPTPPPTA
ncbi:MAG: sulfatase-like hydrolase/transferase [Acidobacteriota bacterium]